MSWFDYCPKISSYASFLPLLLLSIPLYMYLHSSRERKGVLAVEPPHHQENMKHTLSPIFVGDVRNSKCMTLSSRRCNLLFHTISCSFFSSKKIYMQRKVMNHTDKQSFDLQHHSNSSTKLAAELLQRQPPPPRPLPARQYQAPRRLPAQ